MHIRFEGGCSGELFLFLLDSRQVTRSHQTDISVAFANRIFASLDVIVNRSIRRIVISAR